VNKLNCKSACIKNEEFLTESLNDPIDGKFLMTSGRAVLSTGPMTIALYLNRLNSFYTGGKIE